MIIEFLKNFSLATTYSSLSNAKLFRRHMRGQRHGKRVRSAITSDEKKRRRKEEAKKRRAEHERRRQMAAKVEAALS